MPRSPPAKSHGEERGAPSRPSVRDTHSVAFRKKKEEKISSDRTHARSTLWIDLGFTRDPAASALGCHCVAVMWLSSRQHVPTTRLDATNPTRDTWSHAHRVPGQQSRSWTPPHAGTLPWAQAAPTPQYCDSGMMTRASRAAGMPSGCEGPISDWLSLPCESAPAGVSLTHHWDPLSAGDRPASPWR